MSVIILVCCSCWVKKISKEKLRMKKEMHQISTNLTRDRTRIFFIVFVSQRLPYIPLADYWDEILNRKECVSKGTWLFRMCDRSMSDVSHTSTDVCWNKRTILYFCRMLLHRLISLSFVCRYQKKNIHFCIWFWLSLSNGTGLCTCVRPCFLIYCIFLLCCFVFVSHSISTIFFIRPFCTAIHSFVLCVIFLSTEFQ